MPKKRSKSDIFDSSEVMKVIESRPVCKPLNSLAEIMLFLEDPPPWRTLCTELTPHSKFVIKNADINSRNSSPNNPEYFCHYDSESSEVKRHERHESKSLPKTLVCHDMANGYHDDCIIDGTINSCAYTFYNWAGTDIFCYFSHHLLTIPPISWINVGHAHGVKVIGTVVTQHAHGVSFWDDVLSSESQYQNFASALVAVARTLKFDGYLINIENKVSAPDKLLSFVSHFHRLLHDELPHATLLWFDSVTIFGNLTWQNSLNAKNRAFFDACDGLLLNFSWTREDVQSSAALAVGRLTDLYVGIDVWGRHFYGGGQFNTLAAIKVARAAGCSIAVYAPSWTHEALASDGSATNDVAMAEELNHYDKFLLRDRALWDSFWHLLNTKLPCYIPFSTSFCRGQGLKRFSYGEVLSQSSWFNLRHQQYQPSAAHGPHGYLLSTIEKLDKANRESKHTKGIIRIRHSFMPIVDEPAAEAEAESEAESEAEEAAEPATSKEKAPVEPSTESEEIAEPHEDVEEFSERVLDPATVMQPSVSVRLGRKDKSRYGLAYVADEHPCLELHMEDAFSGGSCLMVHPSDKLNPEHRTTRLFHCDFRCDEGLIFCVVTKMLFKHAQQTLNIKLSMLNAANQGLMVVLAGRGLSQTAQLDGQSTGIKYVYPLRTSKEDVVRDLRTYLLLTQPNFYVPVDNAFGWNVRYYEIVVPGSRITAVDLHTGLASGPILLGHFGIAWKDRCTRENGPQMMQVRPPPPPVRATETITSERPHQLIMRDVQPKPS